MILLKKILGNRVFVLGWEILQAGGLWGPRPAALRWDPKRGMWFINNAPMHQCGASF